MTTRTVAQSLRDSLKKITYFYEQNNRILTSNFAGDEDKDEEGEEKTDDEKRTSLFSK